jgi:hypothetical protein|tara:strand:- start:3807 stop:3974 length:168 start_codon:yes stop_codon:yes gene_type:complete
MEMEEMSRDEAVEILDKTIEDAAWGVNKEKWPSLLSALAVLIPESKFVKDYQDEG